MTVILAYVFGIIGGLMLVMAAILWFGADDSDAKGMAAFPLYFSRWPIVLSALCALIHRL